MTLNSSTYSAAKNEINFSDEEIISDDGFFNNYRTSEIIE